MYEDFCIFKWIIILMGRRIRSVSLLLILSLVLWSPIIVNCTNNHHADNLKSVIQSTSSTDVILPRVSYGGSMDSYSVDSSIATGTSISSNDSATNTDVINSRLVEVYEHEFFSKSKKIWIGGIGTSKNNTSVSRWSSASVPNDKLKHLPPPSELSPPKGYVYEGEWMIDMTSETKDELGWEYYLDEKGEEKMGRRRRRWLRTVVMKTETLIEDQPHEQEQRHPYHRQFQSSATKDIPHLLTNSYLTKRDLFLRAFRDSFNFKGYGLSISKSLIYPSFGFTLRMPITTHFDIFEMRPYIPSIATSMSFSCRPYKLVLNLNCSLPLEVVKTMWWIILDWTMWSFKVAVSLIETICVDLIWKLGCIACLGKILELCNWLMEWRIQGNDNIGPTTQESFQSKKQLRAEDIVLISRHGATILGRQYPRIPPRRSIIYSQNKVQRLGVTAAMHLSQGKGLQFRCSWWNTYFSTVEYYQSLILSWLRGLPLPTAPAPQPMHAFILNLQQRDSVREIQARLMKALFGIIWGGFTPEAPYYTCTAVLSMSGFYGIYGGESIKRFFARTRTVVDPSIFDSGVANANISERTDTANEPQRQSLETYDKYLESEETEAKRKIAK